MVIDLHNQSDYLEYVIGEKDDEKRERKEESENKGKEVELWVWWFNGPSLEAIREKAETKDLAIDTLKALIQEGIEYRLIVKRNDRGKRK